MAHGRRANVTEFPATGICRIQASGNAPRGPGGHAGVDGLVPASGKRAIKEKAAGEMEPLWQGKMAEMAA
jgi:hypothetical protein